MSRDTRTSKSDDADGRGQHAAAQQDAARVNATGTELTLEEQKARLFSEFIQEALPTAPEIDGFHMCWLSTTHGTDTIDKRLRIGYQLVHRFEVPGFSVNKTSSAETDDLVRCNEMILAKIPLPLYQMIMKEFHHDRPLREEEAIHAQIESFTEADSKGRVPTVRDEGMEERSLVRRAPVPEFA